MAKALKCPVCGTAPLYVCLEYTGGNKVHSFTCSNYGKHTQVASGTRRTKRAAAEAWGAICKDVNASNPSNPVNPVEKKEVPHV